MEKLSHYWESLPAESPLRARYAPPAVMQVRVLAVLGVMAVGVWIMLRDSALYGLLIAVAGLLWGVWMTMGAWASQLRRDQWAASKLCLECTRRYT